MTTAAMATVEKLLAQIFERRNRIIQQVKQQTDIYTQHLASKCLVDGFTPPPWLWNENQSSGVVKELNKEDLISEILLPHPRPTIRFPSACCSLYNEPVAGDNGELVDGFFKETSSYSKCFVSGDKQAIAAGCLQNSTGCTMNVVPELDVCFTSPADEAEVRISHIYSAPDQSVARIQRSKSRQKALEVRNSAKASSRSRVNQKNDTVVSPASRLSMFSSEQDQVMSSQEFGEPCVMNHESCRDRESNEQDNDEMNKEKGQKSKIYRAPDQSIAKLQRSNSGKNDLEFCNSAKASTRSHLNQKNDAIGSPARSRLSMFSSEQDQIMNIQECSEPCIMRRENYGDGESNERDNENTNKIAFFTGTIRRSRSSHGQPSFVKDFQKGDSFTDNLQKNDSSVGNDMHDFQECPNVVNVSLEVLNSDVTAESDGFIEARREDYSGQKKKGTDTCVERFSRTSFSSQQTLSLNKAPEVDVSIHSAMVDGKPLLLTDSRAAHHRDSRSISSAVQKSQAAKYEVENSSDDILVFPDTHDANQLENFETVIGDDLIKDQSAYTRSTLDDTGLETLHSKSSADYLVLMEPKQLVFDDRDECNLNNKFRPTVECKSLEKSPDKVFDNSLHPALLLDYQVSSIHMISKKPSAVEIEVTKEEEIRVGTFASNNEIVGVQINQKQSDVSEDSTVNTFAVDSENALHVPNLNFTCLANIMEPNGGESPHAENSMNIYSEVRQPELHKEGDYSYEAKERNPCAFHPSESKYFSKSDFSCSAKQAIGESEDCSTKEVESPAPTNITTDATGQHCLRENQKSSCLGAKDYSGNWNNESGNQKILESSGLGQNDLLHVSVEYPLGDHENLQISKSRELQTTKNSVVQRKLRSVEVDSWPKSKRRKIQDSFSASPSFRVKKHYASEIDSRSMKLKKVGDDVETVPAHASPVNENTEIEIYQEMTCQLIEGMESSPQLQREKNALNSEGLDEHAETSSSSELKQLGKLVISNLTKDPARVSQGCLIEEMNCTSSDARKESGEEERQYLLHCEGGDNLACNDGLVIERSLLDGKSYLGLDGQLSCGLVQSPAKKDLGLASAGEMMPVLESFIIDPQIESEEVNISGHGINFDKFEFPRTSVERASILEQICKSTVTQTPVMQFSSAFKVHGNQKVCRSVPNGLLECMDLRSILVLNEDVRKQLRGICGNSSNVDLQKMSYSDCLPYSGSRFSWECRKSYASPVGKLWERMSLHTGSSEKRLSSNPELACFPIEEDPGISDEDENNSDMTEKIQEDIGSLIDTCAKREPPADITEANAATTFSAAEKFVNIASSDIASAEVSFKGAHKKVKQKLQNYNRNKSEEKENDLLSIAASGIKKAKESTSSRFSKANSSCKTSSKTERQKLSEKMPKCNNIVSNVPSFIPLVRQKQAAAVCTGKRDIKVKALEAAEVAKRLEEKRQNERKMRKEALKIERARIEQENLRQMELNKKRQEEERKKRDVDNVAKKRLREEEQRKEKERKKRQTEEARRLQREESTLCSQQCERDNKIKKSDNLLKKNPNMVKESRDDVSLEKPETKQMPDEFTVNFQQSGILTETCGTAGDSYEHEKAMPALDKSATNVNSVVQKSPEKSYDISPYQCSDDEEDEEEENIPNKKFIPSWASKTSVALVLPMQQRVQPDVIFPLEGFCRIDEVYPSPNAKRVVTKKGQRYQM